MYSRNRRCSRSCDRCTDEEYLTSPEEEELYRYNLPPRYDGSRFAKHHRRTEAECLEKEKVYLPDDETKDDPVTVGDEQLPECTKSDSILASIAEGIGSEELFIISIMLMIAGGEDSGEMLIFLVLLLLCG